MEKWVSIWVTLAFFKFFLDHEDVDGKDKSWGRYLRGSEVQELLVDQGQRQNLEGHLIDFLILIVTEDSQISVQKLFWSIEVKVEAKQTKDFLLKIDEVLLLALVAIEVLQGIDHVHEVRVLRLLDFGTYQQAS